MSTSRPIIGLAGGIGSGKSVIASLFAELGCLVFNADEQAKALYNDPAVLKTLQSWWGAHVVDSAGQLDRKAVAQIIFTRPDEKKRLENLIHPLVSARRDQFMHTHRDDAQVVAFVWDIPLLFEVGLNVQCDALVFVDAPLAARLERVRQTRGWDESELQRRENLQSLLDKKRDMSNYIIQNTADVGFARNQVREVLSRILAACAKTAHAKTN